jgi:tripartite-type tricarboxylate transporter receptor subunit TctC
MFLKCFFLFILLFYFPVKAQDYPVKPIRAVVGFAPGGPADLVVRPVADKLYELLGQPIVVDYRPGANMAIASELVAKAAADGYTLLATTSAFTMNPVTHAKLSFDTLRDFIPISQTANSDFTLVINPGVPALTLVQFIQVAKSSPNKLTYGSSGNGGSLHMAGEMLKLAAGIKMLHVPYKGGGPGLIDVIAGRVPMTYVIYPSMAAAEKSGKLRALGVTTTKRLPSLPRVPAIAETLPGYQADVWYMLATPAGTPKEIITQLNSVFNKALVSPTLKQSLDNDGILPIGNSPTEAREFLRSEILKWAPIVKSSGARID